MAKEQSGGFRREGGYRTERKDSSADLRSAGTDRNGGMTVPFPGNAGTAGTMGSAAGGMTIPGRTGTDRNAVRSGKSVPGSWN